MLNRCAVPLTLVALFLLAADKKAPFLPLLLQYINKVEIVPVVDIIDVVAKEPATVDQV